MKVIENQCVNCGLPCLGDSCPNRNVPVHYCDECGDDGKLYEYEELELCETCLLQRFTVVPGTDD